MRPADFALVVAIGFLLGSIPFPYLVTRRRGIDLRTVGSGNVGATNLLRVSSTPVAVTVLALDAGKGSLAVWVADLLTRQPGLMVCAALAAMLGHVYPPWLGFRGGKGLATTAGAFAVLTPLATAVATGLFVVVVAVTRVVSLGSVSAIVALPPLAAWFGASSAVVWGSCAASAYVGFRHRSNVRRLWLGTERRLGQRL